MIFHDTEFILYGKRFVIKVNYHENGFPKNELTISSEYLNFVTSFKSIRDIFYSSIEGANIEEFTDKCELIKELIARHILKTRYEFKKELEMLSYSINKRNDYEDI